MNIQTFKILNFLLLYYIALKMSSSVKTERLQRRSVRLSPVGNYLSKSSLISFSVSLSSAYFYSDHKFICNIQKPLLTFIIIIWFVNQVHKISFIKFNLFLKYSISRRRLTLRCPPSTYRLRFLPQSDRSWSKPACLLPAHDCRKIWLMQSIRAKPQDPSNF